MTTYTKSIQELRKQRDKKTKANPLDWLNLAGLFWLEEGENSFGTDQNNKISLTGFPNAFCGGFNFKDNKVTFHSAKDMPYACNHPNPEIRPLISDLDEEPDLITVGRITMKIIVRGAATLVRAWDRESPAGKQFMGFKYYPVDESYRVTAKYVRYELSKIIKRQDIIGTEIEGQLLGQARFSLNGAECTLEAEKSDDKLLFHFTDLTSKVTTYGGGRKFTTPEPEGEELVLDFNLTKNWPCAYTPFATCPVVLQENRLPIKIEAGEKKYFE